MTDDQYDDLPPSNQPAERAVLAAVLAGNGYPTAAELITAADFYNPKHAAVWTVVAEMVDAGKPIDKLTVLTAATAHPDTGLRRLAADGPFLAMLDDSWHGADVGYYAQMIAETAQLRQVVETGKRMAQRAASPGAEAVEVVDWAREQLAAAADARVGVEMLTVPIEEFMDQAPTGEDWVIPHLLARGDRFVLTGSGGVGKSTLLRQVGVCAAAGIHPFGWEDFEPIRVSVFDRENTPAQNHANYRALLGRVRAAGGAVEDRLRLNSPGVSLDLLNPQDALSVLRTVEHDKPDLVYIGPVYKLHRGDPDKEAHVKQVTDVLDRIRQMGCAIITEAHTTKAARNPENAMEPSGANLWTWWPEFGRGLRLARDTDEYRRECTLERWRFDRVVRPWPDFLSAGGAFPWQARQPQVRAA